MLMSIKLSLEISEFDVMLVIKIPIAITSQSFNIRNEGSSSAVDTR